MNDQTRPPNLSGMFIGAAVPFGLVGEIFKAFYAAGIDPRSFELAPVYTEAQVGTAIDELRGKLGSPNGTAQIADQGKPKLRRKRKLIIDGGFKAYLLNLITMKPRTRDELRALSSNKKWDAKSLDARLYDLKSKKLIERNEEGIYRAIGAVEGSTIVPLQQQKPQKVGRRKREGSHLGMVLDYLKKAFPNSVPLAKLRAKFKQKGLRPESASVALHVLMLTGKVERPEPAVYKYVQPKQEIANVEPSQS